MHKDMVDTVLHLETPEGVTLNFRLAGFAVRGMAWFVDFIVRILVLFAVGILGSMVVGREMFALNIILYFFLEWLYPVYFEYFKQGQTPGKKRLNLRVINEDGTPIGLSSSLIRNFLRLVDFFPMLYGVGLISCLLDKKFRRIGDLAAKSVVVYVESEKAKVGKMDKDAKPCPVWVNQEEQKAILAFSLRERELSDARKQELAELLSPMHQLEGDEAVKEVKAYGSYIGGRS